jgi:predicted 2-oxoglutarate/Fe(II)-dependent dioxygenase YbiX
MIHGFRPQLQNTKFGPSVNFDDFLSEKECGRIVSQMTQHKMQIARVSEDGVKNDSVRSAKTCVLEMNRDNALIFEKLEGAISACNYDVYGYDLLGFNEKIQLIRYDPGDFYDWHMDFGNMEFSQRKLSIVVQLTSPDEYEGGDLEFFRNGVAPRDQGTLILFPSFMYHRVTEITKGTRRSLVAWISGNPFK